MESLEARLLLAWSAPVLTPPPMDREGLPLVAEFEQSSAPGNSQLVQIAQLAVARLRELPPISAELLLSERSIVASAAVQRLPDLERSITAATLAAGSKIDLWALPFPRDTPGFHVELNVSESTDPNVDAEVFLLDKARNLLAQMPLPRPGESLSLMVRPQASANGMFLGIVRNDPLNPTAMVDASSPISYTISVDRSGFSGLNPILDSSFSSRSDSSINSVDAGRWIIAPRVDPIENSWGSLQADAELDSLLGMGQDAAGELPLRSAGPSGGVLADGESAPAVGRLEGAVVDLTLVDISPDLEGSVLDAPSAQMTAIASPDGFPLLSVARPPALFNERRETAPSTISEPPVEAIAAAIPERDRTAGRRLVSPSLAFGLGVGVAVTLGLLLPDLMLKFGPDIPRRLLPWEQPRSRRRWPRLFGPDVDSKA